MSSLYESQPNSVKIVLSDDSGEAERFVIGQSLDEVIAVIEASFGVAPSKPAKKPRKKRSTRAEMAAKAEAAAIPPEGVPPSHRRKNRKEPVGEPVGAGTTWP